MNTVIKKYPEDFDVYLKYTKNPSNQQIDGFASHQPVLVQLMLDCERKSGAKPNVVELGIGYGSTPAIKHLSTYSRHYETDYGWYNTLSNTYGDKYHEFIHVKSHSQYEWNIAEPFDKNWKWDIALIDNASGESRQSNLMKMSESARFIVCHDTEELYKESAGAYGWDFGKFKYRYVFSNYNVYTTVVSMTDPIDMLW